VATKQDVAIPDREDLSNALSFGAINSETNLQQNPLAIVSQTSAEIADNTNTSKATVSRFFRQLGYDSQQGAKQAQLALRESGVPIFTQGSSLDQTAQELKNLSLTLKACDQRPLTRSVSA